MHRLGRGTYMDSAEWEQLDDRMRLMVAMRAAQERIRSQLVFSHDAAAAMHGFPAYGGYGPVPHVVGATRGSSAGLIRHRTHVDDDDVVERNGLFLTSPERTLEDIARQGGFARAVGMLDAAFRVSRDGTGPRVEKEVLLERLLRRGSGRGTKQARFAMEFAQDGADSLGESISRVRQFQWGFPEPILQYEIRDGDGLVGFADQAWPAYRLLGEFDGAVKYTRGDYRGGRSASDVVVAEKRREDRMRATGRNMVRWVWRDAHQSGGSGLAAVLRGAGLPRSLRCQRDWAAVRAFCA